MQFFSLLALAAPLAAAIKFTSPALNDTLVQGSTYDLTWSSVDTDPKTFSVFLVNFVNWPPFYTSLAENIDTSAGTYSVHVPCGVDASYGFQFNAINGTNVYVIYTQTEKLFVEAANETCIDPTSTVSTCASATTVTTTLFMTPTPAVHVANGSRVVTSAPQSTQDINARSASCPDTIGWGTAGYGSPVTLSSAPKPKPTAEIELAAKVSASCGRKSR